MREIVFDTETTGLEPLNGDRLVEIGCIEIVNRFPTGKTFHRYINPERDVPAAAFAVHGLSVEFLSKHSRFAEVVEDFLEFIGDAPLIAHNASFDLGFINAELDRVGKSAVGRDRLIDTLMLARRRFPGGQLRDRVFRAPRPHAPSAAELARHAAFIGRMEGAIWAA